MRTDFQVLVPAGWAGMASLDHPPQAQLVTRPNSFKICYSLFKFRNQRTSMAESTSRFGFVAFAETWNGRLAMLGFVIGLGTELLTGQGILGQLGLG
jgi:hypothetical protein